MNIFLHLFERFVAQQKINIAALCILSLALSFVYTNVSSLLNANIVTGIQTSDYVKTFLNYKYFILISSLFLIIFYIYKTVQNNVLTYLTHWTKSEIFKLILKSNNENMRNVNFAEFITPITRISNSCTMLLNEIITNIFPTIGFLFVIFVYFLYADIPLAIGFLLGNIFIFAYFWYFWKDMFAYKQRQEEKTVNNERHILDTLNNIDKVIYRGEVNNEAESFDDMTHECTDLTVELMKYITGHTFVMNILIFIIIVVALFHIILLQKNKKISTTTFIAFLSILFMYRDNILGTVQNIPYNIETVGRIDLIVREFNEMIGKELDLNEISKGISYPVVELPFEKIKFENVSFKYDKTEHYVFENYSKEIYLPNKIIGITGNSGNGKSSFVKLILRLHENTSGNIYIDDVDITKIDPYYIRKNITYINQNSKLFDRKVIENIHYGCKDLSKCNENLKEILAYPKIQELYKNIDIEQSESGALGENLSGGQRQVVNIISGLINPTKILILDEPTNALDKDLKMDILKLIENSKKYKKTIIIITHDKDVYNLFDETISI